MNISFEITPVDIFEYSKGMTQQSKTNDPFVVISFFLTLLFIFSDIIYVYLLQLFTGEVLVISSWHFLPRAGIAILLSAGLWAFSLIQQAKVKRYPISGDNGVFCKHEISLDDEGVTETTEFSRYFCDWRVIEKLVETESHLGIVIRHSAVHIIPKKAFTDAEHLTAFTSFARAHISKVTQ